MQLSAVGDEADRIRHLAPKEAAAAVEGIFVSMLVGEMKKTLGEGGFFGNSPGSQIFDGMFERLMGEEIARKGGLGLASYVEANLNAPEKTHQASQQKTELEGTRAP
jgi:Rod binding domain-containing protein